MALRIRFAFAPGFTLGYSVERLSDGLYYDFADGTFKASPATQLAALAAGTGNYAGLFRDTIASTPQAQFSNGEYAVILHNTAAGNAVVGLLGATMFNGDSGPAFAGASGGDPWATPLPGSYTPGTAGAILGTNLDARVSSRSTYTGGPVAGVMAPVTVGINNDKAGYSLSAAGLDAIAVEAGINVRQALSPILAAAAGALSGAGTGTIIVKGGSVATTRITATTDNAGNRSTVFLNLPA